MRYVVAAVLLLSAPVAAAGQSPDLPRDPFVAGLAGFVMPGAGQAYNGEWDKALGVFVASAAVTGVGVQALRAPRCRDDSECGRAAGVAVLGAALWIGGIADAAVSARRINERLSVSLAAGDGIELAMTFAF